MCSWLWGHTASPCRFHSFALGRGRTHFLEGLPASVMYLKNESFHVCYSGKAAICEISKEQLMSCLLFRKSCNNFQRGKIPAFKMEGFQNIYLNHYLLKSGELHYYISSANSYLAIYYYLFWLFLPCPFRLFYIKPH